MISKNSLWSVAGSAVPAMFALLSVPVMLLALGSQLFSVCSLLISLSIFFFVYDFGIARAITYHVASTAMGTEKVNAAWRQGMVWACIFAFVTAAGIYQFAPWFVNHWLQVDPQLATSFIQSFRIAAYGIPASIACHVFRGILEGHSDFRSSNLGKMVSGSSIFLAPLLLIELNRPYLVEISAAISFTRYLALGFYIYLAWHKINFKKPVNDAEDQESLIKYGAWAAISGLISTLFIYGDRFLVAGYVQADILAVYIGSQDVLIRYLLIPWSLATVLLPQLAAGTFTKQAEAGLYDRHQKKIFWLSLAFLIFVFLAVWIPIAHFSWFNLNQQAQLIIALQAIGVFFAALSQMPMIYLFAKGKPKLVTYIYMFELLLYMCVAPMTLEYANGVGAGLVWAGRLVLEYCLLSYAVNKNKGNMHA